MHVTGRCHCGKITYEAEINPDAVGLCHCTDCQQLSGSPYRASVATKAGHFRLAGEPKIYIKVADSGRRRAQAFCGECGSAIYATAPENPQTYNLRIGSIDQRRQLKPARQIWCNSGLGWDQDLRNVPAAPRDS